MFTAERRILESKLADFAVTIPIDVSYENIPYTPVMGQAYMDCMVLTTPDARYSTIGQVRWVRRKGNIFQININIPDGQGAKPAEDIAGQLEAIYRDQVQDSGATVTFYPATLRHVGNRNGFYCAVMSVPYQVDYPES